MTLRLCAARWKQRSGSQIPRESEVLFYIIRMNFQMI